MRLLLLYWFYKLTFTAAEHPPPSSDTHLRLDSLNTDVTFANTDGRESMQASTNNTDFVINYNNYTTSRIMEFNNSLKTNDIENQPKIAPFKAIVQKEQIYDVKKDIREKRESFHKAEENGNFKHYSNSYLQNKAMPLPKHHPFGHRNLPKKHLSSLFSHKGIFPKHHSTILGSPSERDDSPESIVFKILSSNQNENYNGFKNVGLTETVAYNVTKIVDSNQTNKLFVEKKENLTVEMSYLDSQERETKYSNTHSSRIHKVLDPTLFYDEQFSEEDNNENLGKINAILSNRNIHFARDNAGNNRSSNGKSSMANSQSEFVDGNFVDIGYKNSNDYPNMDKGSQLVTGNENESGDLLGQSNVVNNLYPSTLMTKMTMKDFQNLLENRIIEKGYKENSIATPLESARYKGIPQDNHLQNNSDKSFSSEQTEEYSTEGISSSDKTSSSQHIEHSSTEGISRYPTHITKSSSLGENEGNKEVTESWLKDRATTLTLNHSIYTLPLFIKHGESIVLEDPNDDGIAIKSLTSKQTDANPVISIPVGDFGKQTNSNQLQTRERFDKNKSVAEEKEDSGFNKYTQTSTLEMDSQTEEASTIMVVIKNVTETSDAEKSNDSKMKNMIQFNDTLSDNIIQETTENVNERAMEKGNPSVKDSTPFQSEELDEINVYDRNENGSDEYLQSKPPKDILLNDKIEPAKEDLIQIVSATVPVITDKLSTTGDLIYKSVEETTKDVVAGEYSNVDPSSFNLQDNHSTAYRDTDIDIQGSILDNEVEGEDGRSHPLHEVELFSGQKQGQRDNNNTSFNSSKPNSDSDYNSTGLKEPLTELCFPLTNENEVSLWDIISGNIYLENEGKKTLLKLNSKPLDRCHSGTVKCKLPLDFENSNESIKGTNSLEVGLDEADRNYYPAKVIKRHVRGDKSVTNKSKIEVLGHLSTEQKLMESDQKEIIGLRGNPIAKQISLNDLLLILLTNETSSNSGINIFDTQATMNTSEVAYPRQEIKQVHSITDGEKTTLSTSTLISLLKKLGEDRNVQQVKTQNTTISGITESKESRKRLKRTLVQQQDGDQEKEGGCGCGSMLGRTLPPIPNHDHFLGKRLNIITSIAHAIKDWAINRPTH